MKWRKYQKETYEAIIKAFEQGYDNILVEAPTGFGKSIVNYMVAKHFNTTWYATPQTVLLDQLEQDKLIRQLGGITIIKGKEKYKCLIKNTTVDKAPCQENGVSCRLMYKCPYYVARDQALTSRITGLSFAMLLKTAKIPEWGKRDLLIVDEADDIEGWGVEHGTLRFRVSTRIHNIQELITWAKKRLQQVILKIQYLEAKHNKTPEQWAKLKDYKELAEKLELFIEDAQEYPENWVYRLHGSYVDVKVLNAGYILRRFLWWRGRKRLVTSATIIDPEMFTYYTGLKGKTLFIRVPHSIPAERRPIIYKPIAKMTKDNRDDKAYKEIAQAIEEIAEMHKGENGIIHAHSYEIAREIAKRLKLEGFKVLVHDSKTREQVYKEFLNGNGNKVMIAVGFGRGIDLKYDLARWQIITKIPYPDQSDIRVYELWVRRKRWDWARWNAIKTLVQMYGRIVRAEDDYGVTYILDKSFESLMKYRKMFPEWFLDAIIKEEGRFVTYVL